MPTKNVVIGQRSLTLDARPDRLDLRDRGHVKQMERLLATGVEESESV